MKSNQGWRDERTGRVHGFRGAARELHGGSRAVLQWAEPSDAAMPWNEPLGRALQSGQDAGPVDPL
jgi:hypothetical protein